MAKVRGGGGECVSGPRGGGWWRGVSGVEQEGVVAVVSAVPASESNLQQASTQA